MMADLADFITSELVKHPAAVVAMTVLVGSGVGMVAQPFVLASDFQSHLAVADAQFAQLNSGLCEVTRSLDRNTAEGLVAGIDRELYDLEGIVAKGPASRRDRDRMIALRTEKAAMERVLADMQRLAPCDARG